MDMVNCPAVQPDRRSHMRDLSALVLQRPDFQVQGLPCLLQIFLNMENYGQMHRLETAWHAGSRWRISPPLQNTSSNFHSDPSRSPQLSHEQILIYSHNPTSRDFFLSLLDSAVLWYIHCILCGKFLFSLLVSEAICIHRSTSVENTKLSKQKH